MQITEASERAARCSRSPQRLPSWVSLDSQIVTLALSTIRLDLNASIDVMSALRYLGGVFGVAIAVLAFDAFGGLGLAVAFSNGFARAIGFCAGLSLHTVDVDVGLRGSRGPNAHARI
jgi:hypothetical protein